MQQLFCRSHLSFGCRQLLNKYLDICFAKLHQNLLTIYIGLKSQDHNWHKSIYSVFCKPKSNIYSHIDLA